MSSVTARRAKAIALIKAGLIHSQSDLVKQLKKAGFPVTQATASRDLEEIGAVRGRSASGESIYQISNSDDESISRTMPVPSDLIISVEASGNLAVVRTPPGELSYCELARSLWYFRDYRHDCRRRHGSRCFEKSKRRSPTRERITGLRWDNEE